MNDQRLTRERLDEIESYGAAWLTETQFAALVAEVQTLQVRERELEEALVRLRRLLPMYGLATSNLAEIVNTALRFRVASWERREM